MEAAGTNINYIGTKLNTVGFKRLQGAMLPELNDDKPFSGCLHQTLAAADKMVSTHHDIK